MSRVARCPGCTSHLAADETYPPHCHPPLGALAVPCSNGGNRVHPEDVREVIATLAVPLPLDILGAIGGPMAGALGSIGWTEVLLLTDGTNRIVATPPVREGER